MIQLSPSQKSVLQQHVGFLATLWTITRNDGTVFHFTNHDLPIDIGDVTYTPVDAFNASARRSQEGMADQSLEFAGIIDSDVITHEDLRAGFYDDAKIQEDLVDWRYPFLDPFITSVFYLTDLTFTGERWETQIVGLTTKINIKVGEIYSPVCRYRLGDNACTVNLSVMTLTGLTVSSVPTQRLEVTASIPNVLDSDGNNTPRTDGWFRFGVVTWTSGANSGLSTEVKTNINNKLIFALPTPFDIVVGDGFSVSPGCKKTTEDCKYKFDNIINFGGFPWIPGNDKVLNYPDAHT